MIVTIGGNVGAGNTTLARQLAKVLGYEELYIGGVLREMAAQRHMTIEQFYEELKYNPTLERSVDDRQAELMQEKENLVVQGRIAWFFSQQSPFKVFNIFLAVSQKIGSERTAQRKEHAGIAREELQKINTARTNNELERYRILYNIENFLNPAHYDFTLDTTTLSEDEVLKIILDKINIHA